MSIIEKSIQLNVEKGALPDSKRIEEAIYQAGLDPIRWAIVDVKENKYIISVNGIPIA